MVQTKGEVVKEGRRWSSKKMEVAPEEKGAKEKEKD